MRLPLICLSLLLFFCGCSSTEEKALPSSLTSNLPGASPSEEMSLQGDRHFVDGYPATFPNGDIQVVVEIPAGTVAKWEVDKSTGGLAWEIKDGKPREVQYLGYPGNYGMVPRTLLPAELGGDGDPLDVILPGTALPRGSVVRARLIGVLKLQDRGEQDDKLIAVLPDSPFGDLHSLAELQAAFPGLTDILETWFTNYKGPGKMKSLGLGDESEAQTILKAAVKAYQPVSQ